jgi:hypothetical protein
MLHEQDKTQQQRMDWASRYFITLEWFSYLVNTKEITNPRLLGFYDSIILDSYEKILPKYYTHNLHY